MSVQALLSEVRPNMEIFQAIKAADQLFYKDRVHYVDLKPIFTSKKEGKIEGIVQADNEHKDNLTKPDKKSVGNVQGIFWYFPVICPHFYFLFPLSIFS
ncbi:unnamed protein product [Meloidogyne enterolobii]|uniref:Uncharacterized protein n=1 Tax=Meloidogyne enterolobii TaxID=390850 RepID=A0ACB1B5A7_MELEN